MKYEFGSFSDTQRAIAIVLSTLFLLATLVLATSIIETLPSLDVYETPVIISIIVISIGVIWFAAKKYLDNKTIITKQDDSLSITRLNSTYDIRLADIKSYKYNFYRGVRLVILTRSNQRISINSNDYLSKYEDLERFCIEFDDYIKARKDQTHNILAKDEMNEKRYLDPTKNNQLKNVLTEAQSNTIKQNIKVDQDAILNADSKFDRLPERKKSFYEKKWALPYLIGVSILLFGFIVFVYFDGGNISGVIIVVVGAMFATWGAYLNHNKK